MSQGQPTATPVGSSAPVLCLRQILRRSVQAIRAKLDDPYEPARHYMRGVGPKARARQAGVPG